METCKRCDQDGVMSEQLCADCFWDEDAERKHQIRTNPKWVFERAYSFATTVLGKSHEEAYQVGILAVKAMK